MVLRRAKRARVKANAVGLQGRFRDLPRSCRRLSAGRSDPLAATSLQMSCRGRKAVQPREPQVRRPAIEIALSRTGVLSRLEARGLEAYGHAG